MLLLSFPKRKHHSSTKHKSLLCFSCFFFVPFVSQNSSNNNPDIHMCAWINVFARHRSVKWFFGFCRLKLCVVCVIENARTNIFCARKATVKDMYDSILMCFSSRQFYHLNAKSACDLLFINRTEFEDITTRNWG